MPAAAQRGLSGPTLTAYRRTWRDTVIRAAAARLDPAALPQPRAEEIYAERTRGRGASHHLQVKAALALLYRVLDVLNPFAACLAPKFQADAVEIRHLEAGALGKVLLELRRHRRDTWSATSPRPLFHRLPVPRVGAAYQGPAGPRRGGENHRRPRRGLDAGRHRQAVHP